MTQECEPQPRSTNLVDKWRHIGLGLGLLGAAVGVGAAASYEDGATRPDSQEFRALDSIADTTTTLAIEPHSSAEEDNTNLAQPEFEQVAAQTNEYRHDPECTTERKDTVLVHVSGPGGLAVPAQVSADYMIGNVKVDKHGRPLDEPFAGYSEWYLINGNLPPEGAPEGIKTLCFTVPDGATIYTETYAKGNYSGFYESREDHYTHTMSGRIFPGPKQEIYQTLTAVCHEGTNTGQSGRIKFWANIAGVDLLPTRIVGWSQEPSYSRTKGFGVEDSLHNQTFFVDTLHLAAGQDYVTQAQFVSPDGQNRSFVTRNVPSVRCQDTEVVINFDGSSCTSAVSVAGLYKEEPCTPDEFLG